MDLILDAINNQKPLKELLEGKDEKDLNNSGKSSAEIPLHQAALKCNKEAIEELLAKGVDIDSKNNEGLSALSVLIQNQGEEFLSTVELLLARGAVVPKDALLQILDTNRQAALLLITHDTERKLLLPDDYGWHSIFFGTTDKNRLDVVNWYLSHPQFSFSSQYRGGGPGTLYQTIRTYVEQEQWENAMKLAYCREGIVLAYESQFGSMNEDVLEDNVVTQIFENLTDFSYVDCNGTKLVEIIFQIYLEEVHRFKVSMGKRLLELGAEKEALKKAFTKALNNEMGYTNIEVLGKMIDKLVKTGIDLESTISDKDEQVVMKDRMYLTAAEYGIPDMLIKCIEMGADLFINFDSSSKKSSIDFCMKKPGTNRPKKADECLEIILREIAKRGKLGEQRIKDLVPEDADEIFKTEKLLTKYLIENGNLEILSKVGFFPSTPANLEVVHSNGTCHLRWESGDQGGFPVTGYRVQAMKMGKGQEQLKKIKEVLKSNPKMKMLFEQMGGLEEEFDNMTGAMFAESWQTVATAFYRTTELGEIFELMPEVDKKIQEILQQNAESGAWKPVAELLDGSQTELDVFHLQHGSLIKFRVFAVNANGESKPPAESDFQRVKVKPNQPAEPTILHPNPKTMTWLAPEGAHMSCVTMYRVEGRDKEQPWKALMKVSAEYGNEIKVAPFLSYSHLRVVALNDEEESEPSLPAIL